MKPLPYAGKVYAELWRDSLSPSEILVLCILVSMRDKDGFAFPSHERLCKAAKLSRPHVFRALQKLRSLGWVERIDTGNKLEWSINPPETVSQARQLVSRARLNSLTGETKQSHGRDCPIPIEQYQEQYQEQGGNTSAHCSRNRTTKGAGNEVRYQNLRRLPASQDEETLSQLPDAKLKKRYGQTYALSEHLAQHLRCTVRMLCFPAAMEAWNRMLDRHGSYDKVRDIIDEAMKPENKAKMLAKVKYINPCSVEVWAAQNIAGEVSRTDEQQREYDLLVKAFEHEAS